MALETSDWTSQMAEPNEKLAQSLEQLQQFHDAGRRIIRSRELTRTHRERLVRNGFLREVLRGWFVTSHPGDRSADSTPWYVSFWEFCAAYCTERFGDEWHVSPGLSLLLHAGDTSIPTQTVIRATRGSNNVVQFPFDTAILDLRAEQPPEHDVAVVDGLRMLTPMASLVRAPEVLYRTNPVELRVVLAQISEPSDLLRGLLAGGHTSVAGRIAGALRRLGRGDIADAVVSTMRAAEYDVRERDPFDQAQAFADVTAAAKPISIRLQALWHAHRDRVIELFPASPGLPGNTSAYLAHVDEIYESDAYHSLSIEGYSVHAALIERVRSSGWNPDIFEADRRDADALAARGYWQAFQEVRKDVARIIEGEAPGELIRGSHQGWYREMFQPHIVAGVLSAVELAGYRGGAVYLRGSRHVPPNKDAVRDAMATLFDLLAHEAEPGVRAVLGHWLMGYVHPFPDGNGRTARFLMNAMLASGGYPWTIIEKDDRDRYLGGLEAASVGGDIEPFAEFLASRVARAMEWSAPTFKDEIGIVE